MTATCATRCVSPLWAEDLAGLPPALIIAAEYDSLRDEAKPTPNSCVRPALWCSYACYPGMVHGFLQMAGLVDEAQQAIDEIAAFSAIRHPDHVRLAHRESGSRG